MLNYQIKGRIHVNKKYRKDEHFIFGNEGRLHQAFLNIISNSVQAIKKEGIITIIVQKKGENMEILIEDTGKGIKKDHINKIMDPFFTTKEPGEGTGLGLSITFNIIEQHNGSIDVKSEEGKGTKICIKLPEKR
jgi:signal transduction histidine kinase